MLPNKTPMILALSTHSPNVCLAELQTRMNDLISRVDRIYHLTLLSIRASNLKEAARKISE